MRNNLFCVREYYNELRRKNLIKEQGWHKNLKDECIEIDFEIGETLMKLRKFKDRTDILCGCKFHILRNSSEEGRNAICRAKNVLTLYLIDKCSKPESY